MADESQRWCCMCGIDDPDPRQICPVSAYEMRPRAGLVHLVAYGHHEKALAVYAQTAAVRHALGQSFGPDASPTVG